MNVEPAANRAKVREYVLFSQNDTGVQCTVKYVQLTLAAEQCVV